MDSNPTAGLGARIAASLRAERTRSGLSVSELARRAGVSKATVSQLETGGGNPSVETLWALADALGVPFSVLVEEPAAPARLIRAAETTAIEAAGAPYSAALLSASPPHSRRDLYVIHAEPGPPRDSAPHARGTVEHLVLLSGRAVAGPSGDPVELHPGDYLSYPGDAPHIFEALETGTRAVLITEVR
ncbi:helix-turn-helix domain-containing protein [Gordonia sp. VNK21]|uniref:helix-turn-helix domain-containing protein n=1 Tax=Gordonia sp. VNK21 TaxID=3382483 RepID=UPI0038D4D5E5